MKIRNKSFVIIRSIWVSFMVFIFGFCSYAEALIEGKMPVTIRINYDENKILQYKIINFDSLSSCEEAVKWCWKKHKETEKAEIWYQNAVNLEFHEDVESSKIQEIATKFVLGKIYPLEVFTFSNMQKIECKLDDRIVLKHMFPEGIPSDVLERIEQKNKKLQEEEKNTPEQSLLEIKPE